MLWFTRGTPEKPVLIVVAAIASLLVAARSPGQAPPAPPSADSVPIELYQEPRPKHLQGLDCSRTGARIFDTKACEVLYSGKGGWANVNFMVDTNGKPFEISVSRSSGYKTLDEVAMKAVAASAFEPASLNGMPIESSYVLKYKLWGGPGISGARRDFIKGFETLRKAIDAGDRPAADEALKKLVITNLYEDAYFGMATYFYAMKWGNASEQLDGVLRALSDEGNRIHVLPSDLYKSALEVCMHLQLQVRMYGEALETYKKLEKTGIDAGTLAQFKAAAEKLRQIRGDESSYGISGAMPEGEWFLMLFKRHFRAEVTEGSISQVKLRCQKHYVSFAFDPKLTYDVASKDGECHMEMIGAPGTRFKLVQF